MEENVYRTELTPVSFLRRSALVFPDKTAVVHGDRQYTYREFAERVNRLASGLRSSGLAKQDRVAFLCPNTPCAGYIVRLFTKGDSFTFDCRRSDPSFPAFLPGSRSLHEGPDCLDHDSYSACSPGAILCWLLGTSSQKIREKCQELHEEKTFSSWIQEPSIKKERADLFNTLLLRCFSNESSEVIKRPSLRSMKHLAKIENSSWLSSSSENKVKGTDGLRLPR